MAVLSGGRPTPKLTLTGISIEGLPKLLAGMDGMLSRAIQSLPGILYRLGERIITDAKKQTPVDTGNLKASGHVNPDVKWEGTKLTATLGFGGPAGTGVGQLKDAGYAVYVHENLTARHATGNAKFLEQPMLDWASKVEAHIAAELQRELGRLK